jgi:hypothetical protein
METLLNRLSEIDFRWQERNPLTPEQILQGNRSALNPIELSELLAADSEWRWRSSGVSADVVLDTSISWNDLRPRPVEVYWDAFPDLAEWDQARLRFVEAEFMARSRWGNPPMVSEFCTRFPEFADLEEHLQKCLEEISLLMVEQHDNPPTDPKGRPPVPVRTPLSIGRQSAREPQDAFVLAEGHRLVIASNYQHGVSREHAVLTRQSVDRCLVENVSPLGDMFVNGTLFPPGWSQLLLLPLTIEIGAVRLKFSV